MKIGQVQSLTLTVSDSKFNQKKIDTLYNVISQSKLKGFTFINVAGMFDCEDDEYSDFEGRMKKFKQMGIIS